MNRALQDAGHQGFRVQSANLFDIQEGKIRHYTDLSGVALQFSRAAATWEQGEDRVTCDQKDVEEFMFKSVEEGFTFEVKGL